MNTPDQAIVAAVLAGDRDSFGALVERYQHRLFGLVLMMVRDPGGAEDVAQDTFVRAFSRLGAYDTARPFYPWLAAIAVRLAQNWLRQRGSIVRREGAQLDDTIAPGAMPLSLDTLITDEESRELWRAVSALSSGERTTVTLCYRDGLPVRDIALALGVTTGTVKTLLFRARRHLRERLTSSGMFNRELQP